MKAKLNKAELESFEECRALVAVLEAEQDDFTVIPSGGKFVVLWATLAEPKKKRVPFTIKDTNGNGEISGFVDFSFERGLGIHIENYGTATEVGDAAQPIWVELEDGIPHVIVHCDINEEDATAIVSLENAHVSKFSSE